MKKLWTKLVALTLGAIVALGVGFAVSRASKAMPVHAAETTVTWAGTTALPGTATSIENSPITIKVSSTNTYSNPIRVYANTTITINATDSTYLKSVTYEASSTGNYVTYAQNAVVSPTVTPTVSGKNVTWSFSGTSTTEFTFKPSSQTRTNGISVIYDTSGTPTHTHTPGDPVEENRIEPTCTVAGSYDSVVYCTECEKEISRTSIVIPATGHNYVDGVCSVCGAEEPSSIILDPTVTSSFPYQGITLTVSDGTLTNGTDYRVYKGQTLTITSTVGNIVSIEFTYYSSSYDGGGWESSYTPSDSTWTSPVTSGEQARITLIIIEVDSDEPTPPGPGPTPTIIAKRCYSLITSTDELVATGKYIIVGHTAIEPYDYYALSTTQNGNNRGVEGVNVVGSVATVTSEAVEVVTLGGSTGAWTFGVTGGYLYAASSSSNYLRTQSINDANGEWAISITSEGVVTATAQGSNTHNLLQYNSSSSIFSAYANVQRDIYLYKLDFEETLLGNVVCDGSGSHTLPEGYTWNTDLQAVYNDLPTSEKSSLASKEAAIDSGLDRYDYIIGKYNQKGETDPTKTNYVHFITGRTINPIGYSRILLPLAFGEDNAAITVIIIISLISISSLAMLLMIRKKRIN